MISVSDIKKNIKSVFLDLPSSLVLKERVVHLNDRLGMLQKRVTELEQENARMKQEHHKMAAEIEKFSVKEEFVEHRGALFKRKPGGGYRLNVYCPSCHRPTASLHNLAAFSCSKCYWHATFTGKQLESIMAELPE